MMKPMVRRTATIATAAAVGVLATAGPAAAHVTVDPPEAAAGSHATLNFKVPNESEEASTVKLEIELPENAPFPSAQTLPVPGWEAETEMRDLDEPMDMHGREVDEAVSTITWTAEDEDAGIAPDEFGEFPVSVGPLPDEGEELVFKSIQTYSDDTEAAWIDEPQSDGSEPEEPAPFVTVTAAEDEGHGHGQEADSETTASADNGGNTPVILSAVAAALSLIAVVVAVLAFKRKST